MTKIPSESDVEKSIDRFTKPNFHEQLKSILRDSLTMRPLR